MAELRIFKTKWCGHCLTEIPRFRREANRLGLKVRVLDVEQCPVNLKSECEGILYVPTAMMNGREVTLEELKSMK